MKFLTTWLLLSLPIFGFAQQISVIPNWKIGDKRDLKIMTTLPRDEEVATEVAEIMDDSEPAPAKIPEEIIIDTLYFEATMQVIDKTKQGYTISFAYTDFHVDSTHMDDYTLQSMRVFNALEKAGAVVYETDESGKFLDYMEADALEQAGKRIGDYLGIVYEPQEDYNEDIEENTDTATYEDWEGGTDIMIDSISTVSTEVEEVYEEDSFFENMDSWAYNFLISSFLETSFTQRLSKIHGTFGETYEVGVEKAVDNLSLLEMEELKGLESGMFDITGTEILTDESAVFRYKVDADLQINDFFKKMMEALSALEEDGDKKKKKKKSAEEKEQEKLMQNFRMDFSVLGDVKLEKDTFWPTNFLLSFTVNMNIPGEGEVNMNILENITFTK
ncbi:MAG: hypothetical protein K1X55_15965 [Chitinophagales bacterium]|nr:hypothetical protein [Chitinophagales bacterium]